MPAPLKLDHAAILAVPPAQREGTALEWSCVTAIDWSANKSCRCCAKPFAGGPDRAGKHMQICTLVNGDPLIKNEFAEIKALLAARAAAGATGKARASERAATNSTATVSGRGGSLEVIDLDQRSSGRGTLINLWLVRGIAHSQAQPCQTPV